MEAYYVHNCFVKEYICTFNYLNLDLQNNLVFYEYLFGVCRPREALRHCSLLNLAAHLKSIFCNYFLKPFFFRVSLFLFILWYRPKSYWLGHFQSLLYCSENNQLGTFSEELHSCSCRYEHSPCQLPPPCSVGEGSACASCAADNHTRCGSCNQGFTLIQGACRPMVADSTENYLGFEMDLQDLELGYLLQRADRRLEVFSSTFRSLCQQNDVYKFNLHIIQPVYYIILYGAYTPRITSFPSIISLKCDLISI